MRINVRSPFLINVSTTNLTSAKLELYIYTGTQGVDRSGNLKYTLSSTALNEEVTFEIAELVRDYLDITFDGSYTAQMVWVDYQITESINDVVQIPEFFVELLGWDGYGYFNDGANPQNDSELLQSNTLMYKPDDSPIRIPIEGNASKNITFFYNNEEIYNGTTSPSSGLSGRIKYISNAGDGIDGFEERVLADGGIFETNECIEAFFRNNILYPVDKIIISGSNTVTTIVDVVSLEECKFTPYKITFVNKFGVLQDLWFFKRSDVSITTKEQGYKGNILTSDTYSISEHQNKTLTKQGQEKISLNSGFVDEQYNEVFRQLMLSEKVWIEYDLQTLPVKVTNNGMQFKQKLNDKLINYSIECDFAFDKINSVR